MTVYGGPSFREWQLGRLRGSTRFTSLINWMMRDVPTPLVIRSGARSHEDQARLVRERWERQNYVHYRAGLAVMHPPALIKITGA